MTIDQGIKELIFSPKTQLNLTKSDWLTGIDYDQDYDELYIVYFDNHGTEWE